VSVRSRRASLGPRRPSRSSTEPCALGSSWSTSLLLIAAISTVPSKLSSAHWPSDLPSRGDAAHCEDLSLEDLVAHKGSRTESVKHIDLFLRAKGTILEIAMTMVVASASVIGIASGLRGQSPQGLGFESRSGSIREGTKVQHCCASRHPGVVRLQCQYA
jgi:hypothetical protein